VLGRPDARQAELLATYREIVVAVRAAMRPGITTAQLDDRAKEVAARHGLAEYQCMVSATESGCASRSRRRDDHPAAQGHAAAGGDDRHDRTPRPGDPGLRGARFEDVYRLAGHRPEALSRVSIDPIVEA